MFDLDRLGLAPFDPGTVWLTGAGPGDPGLLTAYALYGLGTADIVVYDALVDPRILDLAHQDAKLDFAGKRGGRPSVQQPGISARLVEHAQAGLRVLRLKGGDPFIFGRGAEEALALVEAGVKFKIVPGISAGTGGLAYAGIPLTHRDTNSAVTLLTGAGADGTTPANLDWTAIARGAPVLVFYMPIRNITEIVARLIEGGRSATEPCAVIAHATTAHQRVVTATLETLTDAVLAANIQPPSLLVVGEVVRLRDKLNWLTPFAVEPSS
jgi:uroporphyrin-III C-methyltransferase